jgi:hypothetical protein
MLHQGNLAEEGGILAVKVGSGADMSCLGHAAQRHRLLKATLQYSSTSSVHIAVADTLNRDGHF